MDRLFQHRQSALKNIQKADYMLATTYPLLKETKTLITISDHLLSSFMSSISMLLILERSKKNIPPYHETDESKLNSFKQYLVKKYKFQEYLETIERIINISKEHEKSPVEFSRDNKYIILNEKLKKAESISEDDIKDYIKKAKDFAIKISEVVANE